MENPAAYSDKELLEKTISLVNRFGVSKIYETGTFYGESTYILGTVFTNLKIYSYELIADAHKRACQRNHKNSNVFIRNISSPEGLRNDLVEGENNVLLFLDAHWYEYWPILDELSVIASKKIKPCIVIHDFYIPSVSGDAKFGHDSYQGQVLDFNYIKEKVELIYGSEYEYCYSQNPGVNSGVIYIYPKL